MAYPFNVRVYGLVLNEAKQVLLSDEEENGFRFTKFPGGGLEFGEGLLDALKREFVEECNLPIEIVSHFYTTDFFIQSVFNESQVISIYYLVKPMAAIQLSLKEQPFDFDGELKQAFRWKAIADLSPNDLTFETDQRVAELLLSQF